MDSQQKVLGVLPPPWQLAAAQADKVSALQRAPSLAMTPPVISLSYSQHGGAMVAGGCIDGCIRLWTVSMLEEVIASSPPLLPASRSYGVEGDKGAEGMPEEAADGLEVEEREAGEEDGEQEERQARQKQGRLAGGLIDHLSYVAVWNGKSSEQIFILLQKGAQQVQGRGRA